MRTKLLSMMIIVTTCMLLRIMITMKLVILILIFNHMIVILLKFALTILNEKNFADVESSKISMLVDHEKNALMVILLNPFMMLLKIIMREEYMLVGVAIISSFLSMCLKF